MSELFEKERIEKRIRIIERATEDGIEFLKSKILAEQQGAFEKVPDGYKPFMEDAVMAKVTDNAVADLQMNKEELDLYIIHFLMHSIPDSAKVNQKKTELN